MALTLLQQHIKQWSNCQGCPLHRNRNRMVFVRGKIPCDILFIGEAPGESEDIFGQPFVGVAGMKLDAIIEEGLRGHTIFDPAPDGSDCRPVRFALTNLVCCIPRDEEGAKSGEPEYAEVMACSSRLVEFVEIADPKLIICVGKQAADYLLANHGTVKIKRLIQLEREIPMIEIVHPAAILRMPEAQKGFAARRASVQIRQAVEEHLL